MPEQLTRNILLKSKACEPTRAVMHIETFSPQEQKIRAAKSLLGIWLVAALCVFIPIAHFILVPGFLIAGVVAASRKLKLAEEGREASGECPTCHHPVTIDLEKSSELPQWRKCPDCGNNLELAAIQKQT